MCRSDWHHAIWFELPPAITHGRIDSPKKADRQRKVMPRFAASVTPDRERRHGQKLNELVY